MAINIYVDVVNGVLLREPTATTVGIMQPIFFGTMLGINVYPLAPTGDPVTPYSVVDWSLHTVTVEVGDANALASNTAEAYGTLNTNILNGKTGFIDLNTVGIQRIVAGNAEVLSVFEIKATPPGGTPSVVLQVPVTVKGVVLPPGTVVIPTALPTNFYPKQECRVATTGNITLANLQTIDGVALVATNRVLVKNQTLPAENGIYDVVAGGAWTRSTDADVDPEIVNGSYVFITEGQQNISAGWVQITADPVIIGTSPQLWVQFSSASQAISGPAGGDLAGDYPDPTLRTSVQTVVADYVIDPVLDSIINVNGAGTVNVTLPAATLSNIRVFCIKNLTSNLVNVLTAGGTIDGMVSDVIQTRYTLIEYYSDGTNWFRR